MKMEGLCRNEEEDNKRSFIPSTRRRADTDVNCSKIDHHHKFQQDASDPFTLVALLKACANHKDLQGGSKLYADIAKRGLHTRNIFVGNALITMYAKCGALAFAQELFDELPTRNNVSWNVLITGYAQQEHGDTALACFERMQLEALCPDRVTFLGVLKACASLEVTDKGQNMHALIANDDVLAKNIVVGSTLVDMYAKCGSLAHAHEVFDKLPTRNVVSWNALIGGYAQHSYGEEALELFEQMQHGGFSPDRVTFICMLKACGSVGALDKGHKIHAEILKDDVLKKDIVVVNALLDMYAKSGALVKAQEVFDKLPVKNVISWTTLIAGYAQHGHGEEALNCFDRMQAGGLSPNAVTFICVLKACGSIGALDRGQEVHAEIAREGLLHNDIVTANALLDMYGKCGSLEKAQEVFDTFPIQNVITWTTLIAGYVQHGHGEEALDQFECVQQEGVLPNAATFVCILKACGSIGAVDTAHKIHAQLLKDGSLECNLVVATVLIDMYANCGMLAKAQVVFDNMPVCDVVVWNTVISGYALVGRDDVVYGLINKMLEEGKEPNSVTLTAVLNMCSHTGLLVNGQMYFEILSTSYGVVPTLEHYTCMVDMLSRTGNLDKAAALAKDIPYSANIVAWLTVLGACGKLGNMELGTLAFEHATPWDEIDATVRVCMSNIYAVDAAGSYEDHSLTNAKIEGQAWNKSGHCCWIDAR